MSDEPSTSSASPISANARRVLGVLVEKAKTTPDSYPLTVAAIITGSNQKSNRSPKMELDETDALNALDELRAAGAAREIQGSGRATKYRHAMYGWMGIEAAESAIMTELLLRGPQTVGELRTRASRMHPFDDLDVVRETLEMLETKNLVHPLTPAGRGQVFAHRLYQPTEAQHVAARVEKLGDASAAPKSTASENRVAVDELLKRLESVNQRIDDLEKRIADLES
ncbi:MAG: YceH family protein [Planctomycetota bacterium]